MAKLSLTFSDIYKEVAEFLGFTDSPTDADKKKVKKIVWRGYRNFLYPLDITGKLHHWSFLSKHYTFTTNSEWKYALPDDFSEILTDPVFDKDTGYPQLTKVDGNWIMRKRAAAGYSTYPEYYAIVSTGYSLETGTKYEMWLYPTPNQGYLLSFFYRFDPSKPEDVTNLLVGGVRLSEAILESCLAVAEHQYKGELGIHNQLATELIRRMVVADKVINGSYIGNLYGPHLIWPRDYNTISDVDITTENMYSGD